MTPLRYLVCFAVLLRLASSCYAQSPVTVNPCDLVKDPAKFNNQLIQVRAQVSIAFEDFSLMTDDCDANGKRSVWLMYGGDEPTPTMSTVNDQERKPGSAPKLHGKTLSLRRDRSLDLFRNRLVAQRIGRPAGEACYDRECYLYDVTATITGTFLSASKDFRQGGYGHLGCCHLLVIQAVDSVNAVRTAVPAGGQFKCVKDTWNLNSTEVRDVQRRPCGGLKDCQLAVAEQLTKVALHWGDKIRPREGTVSAFAFPPRWDSPDLLNSYELQFQFTDQTYQTGEIRGAQAIRSTCRALSPPYPQTTPISCRKLWSEFPVSRADSESIQQLTDGDKDAWRMTEAAKASQLALVDAAARWGVTLVSDLRFDECSKPSVFKGDLFTWCNWSDPNSMQALSVQLTRFGHLKHGRDWRRVPWILTRGDGLACSPELNQ